MKISVIIPTYQRPDFLIDTVRSVWAQSRLPDEILIGDDSQDEKTASLVEQQITPNSPVPIRYFHHRPALREAANVSALYQAAQGTHVLHLHDDDPILPECLELLASALENHPQAVASFGLQYAIDHDGKRLDTYTEGINRAYFRTEDRAGLVDGFIAGATSMFPNNGFLIEADVARAVGYHDHGVAGSAVDYYFGLRLGAMEHPMVFVNHHTCSVRITRDSSSRVAGADNSYSRMRHLLESLKTHASSPEIEKSIRHHLPFAIANAAQIGKPGVGWKWFFSMNFLSSIPTIQGLKCAVHLLRSSVSLGRQHPGS